MYDRKTDSYWTQLDGLAIIGELTGTELKTVNIDTVAWRDWKNENTESEVLSRDTGYPHYRERYGYDPYGGYYEEDFTWFPLENEDNRIHAKTVIFGIEVDGKYKAYREDDLIELGTIEDNVDGIGIKLERDDSGTVTIINLEDGKDIVKDRGFWFAWYAFHPETELYIP